MGDGDDTLKGGAYSDTLDGGAGTDETDYSDQGTGLSGPGGRSSNPTGRVKTR